MSTDDQIGDTATEERDAAAWLSDYERRRKAREDSAPDSAWSGNDVDGMLRRAEFGVVSFGSGDVMTCTFRRPSELRAWVEDALPGAAGHLRVYGIDVAALDAQARGHPPILEKHVHPHPGGNRGQAR